MFTLLSQSFADFMLAALVFSLRIFAILPLTPISIFHEIHIICWIIGLSITFMLMFINNEMNNSYSIGSLVSCALFISQILSHIIALGESYFTQSKQKELYDGFAHIDKILKLKLQYTLDPGKVRKMVAQQIIWIYTILWTVTVVMIYTHQSTKNITVLFWYSFLSTHALRGRCMQVILTVIGINIRLRVIKNLILDMVKEISKNDKLYGNMVALANDANIEKVASLKMAYNQLYKMIILLNDCYGWSLLTIYTSYFIDFITNCYWIFMTKITTGKYEVYILNGSLVLSLVLQLTVICWHCQECENYSKNIGGSIFKLAKPLGNKRYNDLVSEFSLQALHQTFAVTAKEFFRLNLDLLGSMIGAIVTYLVILIQFMFTEKNGAKISVPNSYLSGAIADVILKNQTNNHLTT